MSVASESSGEPDQPGHPDQPAITHDPAQDGYEVRLADKAARDRSAVEHGRRIGGVVGAAMAGAMIAIRDIVEPAKDDQSVAVSESPDEPHDVDRDGVHLTTDEVGGDVDIAIAALAPKAVIDGGRRRARRRQR